MNKSEVIFNRKAFLYELRFGNHKKGTIRSDQKGNPIIECEDDNNGHCACAIATEMFGITEKGNYSINKAMKALGITTKECKFIQQEINDTPLDFNQVADRIEVEIFKNHPPSKKMV